MTKTVAQSPVSAHPPPTCRVRKVNSRLVKTSARAVTNRPPAATDSSVTTLDARNFLRDTPLTRLVRRVPQEYSVPITEAASTIVRTMPMNAAAPSPLDMLAGMTKKLRLSLSSRPLSSSHMALYCSMCPITLSRSGGGRAATDAGIVPSCKSAQVKVTSTARPSASVVSIP